MRFICLLLILNLILNLTFGELTILTKYVSFVGKDEMTCGDTRTNPCKTIKFVLNYINPQYYDDLSIEILLEKGNHFIGDSINLYGLNITISAVPGENVNILLSNPNSLYNDDNLQPPFVVHNKYVVDPKDTIISFKDFSVQNCYGSDNNGNVASFLQSSIQSYYNPVLKVNVENVKFECTLLNNPFFSLSNGADYNSNSESYNNYNPSSSSSSDSYDDDVKKVPSRKNLESSYNVYDSSSSDYNPSYQPYSYIIDQTSEPMDLSNVSFTFNNCLVNGANSYRALLFHSYYLTSPLLTVTNTNFTNIVPSSSIIAVNGGKVVLENVSFSNFSSTNYNVLFDLNKARISFDKVNFNGNITSSIVYGQYVYATFKQFDVNVFSPNYSPNYVFSFINSWVSFENCTQSVQSTKWVDPYTTSSIFNVQNSNINLYSNRLSTNSSNIVYTSSSSVWANSNIFNITYHQNSNYNQLNFVYCNSPSKLYGDWQFTNQNLNSNCNNERTFTNFIYFNSLEVSISFLAGVLSMSLLFVLIFSISACCKCKRRRIKKIQIEKQALLSINSDTIAKGDDETKVY